MPSNTIILTPEGRQKLIDELEYRQGQKHDEIIEAIREARAQGDLSENAEYDAAKEEQSKNESRMQEIRHILETARVEQNSSSMEVSIGCTVELQDAKGKKTTFTIVGTTETNSLEHKISNESPAGAALIGHVAGDTVSFATPTGKVREYVVTRITR
ncbi:MAG: transcription elongation factor GreA [Atopobiaceae bacterium]